MPVVALTEAKEGSAKVAGVPGPSEMKRFVRDTSGATSIEYALIATLISIVIIGGEIIFGSTLSVIFTSVSSGFTSSR